MKWLYLILAVAVLALASLQLYGAFGAMMGWWFADREVYYWGFGLLGLAVAGFTRAWLLFRRRPVPNGFPVITGGGREGA